VSRFLALLRLPRLRREHDAACASVRAAEARGDTRAISAARKRARAALHARMACEAALPRIVRGLR
jgi:hypothetical protein